MRRTIILSAALAIILLGLWGTAVIYFDEAKLRGIVSERLSEQLGRRVQIAGSIEFGLFPRPYIEARDLIVDGPASLDGRRSLAAERVSMSLQVMPLLRGRISPAQMTLSGAVVRLDDGAEADPDPGDAGQEPDGRGYSLVELLSGRSLRLDDVTVVLPPEEDGPERTIAIELVELDRFSPDETVDFRFRGDIGDPVVLEEVQVDGSLYVPTSTQSSLRLRDMQLQGSVVALDRRVSLQGDLSASREPPLRVSLSAGRLTVGEHAFNLSLDYRDGPTPALDLLASGALLNTSIFESLEAGAALERLAAGLSRWTRHIDLRSQLQIDRIRAGRLLLADTRLDLRSRPEGLGISIATLFPGGVIEGSGILTGGPRESLVVDVSMAEFEPLFSSLDVPDVLSGSGEAKLSLAWARPDRTYVVEGEVSLWDGAWRGVDSNAQDSGVAFDRFDGTIRWTPGQLAIPEFDLRGSDVTGMGWAAIELPGGAVAGEFYSVNDTDGAVAISGSWSPPRIEVQLRTDEPDAEGGTGRDSKSESSSEPEPDPEQTQDDTGR